MKRHYAVLFALAAAVSIPASADTIGSLVLSSAGATINGTNLADSTMVTPSLLSAGFSTGDFTVIAAGTPITGGVLDGGAFSITIDTYGTFTAPTTHVISFSPNFADVYFLGTFTGAGALAGNSGPASVRISLNQSGSSVSYGGTLAAPPQVVPEPTTFGTIGACLVGLAGFLHRRSVAKR